MTHYNKSNEIMLNLDFIRSQFPGLDTDWVLLDNAGGSQILKPVVDRMNEHLYTSHVQLGGSYPHSVLAEERHSEGHRKLAEWVNARHNDEIIMGSATSLLIKILADNFRRIWKIFRNFNVLLRSDCNLIGYYKRNMSLKKSYTTKER